MKFSTLAAAAALATAAPAMAATTIVTFDELAVDGTGLYSSAGPIESGGLTFTRPSAGTDFYVFRRSASQNADPGGATLGFNASSGPLTTGVGGFGITRTGGGEFTLNSIAISDFSNSANPRAFRFVFNTANGQEVVDITTDAAAGLQTIALNRSGLLSVSLGGSGFPQIDNVSFTVASATAPVPEPATWAMMIVGFGAVGATLRRRRPAVAFG